MHTSTTLNYEDFGIEVNGNKAGLEDIFPDFNAGDRIGIVTRSHGGSMGASALIMSAITRFYDFHRSEIGNEQDKMRIYPEIFVFHVGTRHMLHEMMDIWPAHRDVVVEDDDPEQILEAINDRGITRLVVEDIPPSPAKFLRATISSAKYRIVSALAYSPTGRVEDGNVKITSTDLAEEYTLDAMNASEELTEDIREELKRNREKITVDGRIVETYRIIEPRDAVNKLTLSTDSGDMTMYYAESSGLKTEEVLLPSGW